MLITKDTTQAELEDHKVYWSDKNFIFRKDGRGYYSSYLAIHGSGVWRFERGAMSRSNFSEPTPTELHWFEYCESIKTYVSMEDYLKLYPIHDSPQIQLYPL
jgi:hypothetical protein